MARSRKRWFRGLLGRAFLAVMFLGAALIIHASVVYFESGVVPAFVRERLPVRFESLWLAALRLHVASALVSLPLCALLMTRWLQRKANWHRRLGRLAGMLLVGAVVPSGAVLAFEAKGGVAVTLGFLLSGAIVLVGVVAGVGSARRRDYAGHARAMRHVFAQMSVAVTSRALLVGFHLAGLHPDLAYVAALWLPVLASAVVAELLSGQLRLASRLTHLTISLRRFVEPTFRRTT